MSTARRRECRTSVELRDCRTRVLLSDSRTVGLRAFGLVDWWTGLVDWRTGLADWRITIRSASRRKLLDGWASTTHLETVERRTVLGGREHQAHDQVEQAHCLVRGPGIGDLTPSVSQMFLVPLCEAPNLWQQITKVFGRTKKSKRK